jgi:Ca2+-binding EF-hand superfamily protein
MKALLMGGAFAAMTVGTAIAQPAPPTPPGVAQGTAPAPLAPRAPLPPRAERQIHMQMMSDHVMTRDEVVQHVRKMFERLDTNHDGYVTREEANAMFAGLDGLPERMEGVRHQMDGMREHMRTMRFSTAQPIDPGAMFDRLDTNHDGVISRQEFMTGHARGGRTIEMRGPGAMAIPPVPPIPPMPAMPPMPDMKVMHMHAMGGGMGFGGHLFDMADANHDGRVSLQEAESAALAHFDRADVNHDGRITPDERQHVRMIRIERRQS